MNSTMRSVNVSSPIGTPSSSSSTGGGLVIQGEFHAGRPVPLKDAVSLSKLIVGYRGDPIKAAAMANARTALANTLSSSLADELRRLRLAAGLSQTELAALVGTSQPHIVRIERGHNDPGTDLVDRMAVALGVDAGIVFGAIRAVRTSDRVKS